jgi:uncharacterized membrane protein YtjA (UPF0391 family)
MRKAVLILVMLVGAMLFFMGALGVFNQGFRGEIPGAPVFLAVGLVLMVFVTVVDRRKASTPREEARARNRSAIKSVLVLIAVIAGALGFELIREGETAALVKGMLLFVLAVVFLVVAFRVQRRGKIDEWK